VACRSQRGIYTVDVDLDQIMTAYKLTVPSLCQRLMHEYGLHEGLMESRSEHQVAGRRVG